MRSKYYFIPEPIKEMLFKTGMYKNRAKRNKTFIKYSEVDAILNEAPVLKFEKEIKNKPLVAIIRTKQFSIGEKYVNPKESWLRYERFCKNNSIPYDFFDISKSDWIIEAKKYDIFVCHAESTPVFLDMIESKIYVLEKIMGKSCFPSFHEVWQYENKNRANYLYQLYNIPTIPTYVTQNQKEAFELIEKVGYPFITKTTIGAASSGVEKIDTKKQAAKKIRSVFSYKGLKTQYPYLQQKDYFYIQEFIDDATFDLRIMIVGDMAFGYYRYPNKGDFRASGAGNTEKKAIPREALLLAIDVRNKLNSRQMGVDMLYSTKQNKYFIIETSLFNQIDTPEQLVIDGVPGYFDISDINNIQFKKGRFWVQELVLRNIIKNWVDEREAE